MVNYAAAQWNRYKALELIPDSVPEPHRVYPHSTLDWLQRLWRSVVDAVMPHNELKIWQTADSSGNVWWHVYDPHQAQTMYMASEEEVLLWLDQHYKIG